MKRFITVATAFPAVIAMLVAVGFAENGAFGVAISIGILASAVTCFIFAKTERN